LAQPKVCVHRDYHSRNLLLLADNDLGIIDFQDALIGSVTYDAVSLLRDCYIAWPAEKVTQWLDFFYQQIKAMPYMNGVSGDEFSHWFDWQGVQRHLKAVFIFARKSCRDQDHSYLADIPRGLAYVAEVLPNYTRFREAHALLTQLTERFNEKRTTLMMAEQA
jgi:aminoglycoside/choline kinase family phosphotransferase